MLLRPLGLATPAAYGLLNGSKAILGGFSNYGFGHIKRTVRRFFPGKPRGKCPANSFRLSEVLWPPCRETG